jgi:uncharacterized protein DUF6680
MSAETWAIVAATFLGPVFAVLVSLQREQMREARNRRFMIFRALMATRGNPTIREHVDALNLVEVDFYGFKKVQDAYRPYLAHLNDVTPDPRWNDKRLDLLAKLLRELSEAMKMPVSEIDIRNGGYSPKAWDNTTRNEIDQWTLRLTKGKEALPINIVGVPQQPPPSEPPPPPTPRMGFFSQPGNP